MNPSAAVRAASQPLTFSPGASFVLLASVTVSFMAGSIAPTPLYSHYQAQWGFSSLTITVIFGIYALAVLLALLFLGRLSDHVGRRPVLFAAIAGNAVAMLMFWSAGGLAMLLASRVVQGLAVGAALAAVGAGLLDLDRNRGALANAIIPPLGTATGGLIAGLIVGLAPAGGTGIYLLYAVVFLLQGVALFWMRDTFAPRPGALASLRPQFSFSAGTRGPLLHAAPVIIASWVVAGFYASLGPAIMRNLQHGDSALLSGLIVFAMASSGAVTVLLLQRRAPLAVMRIGAVALASGSLLVITALAVHSPALFFAGVMLSGAGFGGGFQGAVRHVVSHVHADERAGVLSVIFVIAYLAMGLPAVMAGYLLLASGDVVAVVREFGLGIAALALLPSVVEKLRPQPRPPRWG